MGPTKPKDMRFTSKQIESSLSLRLNTLHNYCKAGAITPEIDEGKGTGHQRVFSATNYVEAIIIKQLMNLGMPQAKIVMMLKSIVEAGDRRRLDPQRYLDRKEKSEYTELLVFTMPDNKARHCHRFVMDDPIHGKIMTRREARGGNGFNITSSDQTERLSDFTFLSPALIVFNLDVIMGFWLFGQLVRMADDGAWTK